MTTPVCMVDMIRMIFVALFTRSVSSVRAMVFPTRWLNRLCSGTLVTVGASRSGSVTLEKTRLTVAHKPYFLLFNPNAHIRYEFPIKVDS